MMKLNRTAGWLAWGLCALTALLQLTTLPLLLANHTRVADILLTIPAFLAFAVIGALIVAQQPRNIMGWLYCVIGISAATYSFAQEYAAYTLITRPHRLPGGLVMAWLGHDWTGSISWYLLILVAPLLFPDGRLPTPGWRRYGYLLGFIIGLFLVVAAFRSTPMDDKLYPQIPNPLGSAWADRLAQTMPSAPLFFLGPLISFAALVMRYRRAQQTQRQQIKWLAYAAALIPLAVIATALWTTLHVRQDVDYWLTILFWAPVYSAFPIATGIAILRHRLYEIDRLVSRTLGYGVLTTLLALIYFGSMVVLGTLAPRANGLATSQFITVFSTLLIAALFNPLRRRVQTAIDQRFYRRQYNAEQVLAAFGETVRNETDLAKLTSGLIEVVEETLQPISTTLWLKPTTRQSRE